MCTLDFFVVPDDETCLSDTGWVINLYPGLYVNRYTQSTRERLTNMITVLHHCIQPAASQFSNLSSLRRPGIGTLVTNPVKQASRSCLT
jgi:hypothetical protein